MSYLKPCPLCTGVYSITALRTHMWKSHKEHMKNISTKICIKGFFIEDTDKIIEEIRLRKVLLNNRWEKRIF